MKNLVLRGCLLSLVLSLGSVGHAQLYTVSSWSSVGTPGTSSPGPLGSSKLVQSGSSLSSPNVVDAATLQTFLGATLPSTGQGTPTYGQATATTITASSPVTFRLTYSYQTNESVNSGYDSAGYVLNGTYYELGSSTASGLSSTNGAGGFHNGITTVSTPFNLASGSNFLGFVAYNTDDNEVSSGPYR